MALDILVRITDVLFLIYLIIIFGSAGLLVLTVVCLAYILALPVLIYEKI